MCKITNLKIKLYIYTMFKVYLKSEISHAYFCFQMIVDSLKKSVLFLLHGTFPDYIQLEGCIHPYCRKQ